MNIQELCDKLATLCGWTHETGSWTEREDDRSYIFFKERWVRGDEVVYFHPFPVGDLTSLAKAWPDGWMWERYQCSWQAKGAPRNEQIGFCYPDTGDEFADRLRLTVTVKEESNADSEKGPN